ncbi:MAG: TraB/GumN family protein [Deltaproteobacteria bacterium]|nr:TraB/GumN family protein [Deltaproteobacteria bacterium]
MKKILLGVFLVFVFCAQSQAESSVWKVQKGDSVMYVGGTIHLLRQSDYPLPQEFEKAYASSDMLVFEVDLGKANDPSVQQKLLSKAMYTDGTTVDMHLSADVYKLLNEHCLSNGIPIEQLKMFKPQIIAVLMDAMELAKLGVAQDGVDMFFYKAASKDNKAVEGLETIDEQIDYLLEMGKGNEDDLVSYTINDIDSTKKNFEIIVDSWKRGDVDKLDSLIIGEIKTKMPEIYKNIITDRNNNWMQVIEKYFANQKTEFVMVGMAHLVGTDGIIEMLSKKGYKIEKL